MKVGRWFKILALASLLLVSILFLSEGQPPKPFVFAATAQVISFFGADHSDPKLGSGSFVASNLILTNAHVVQQAPLEEGCGKPIDPQRAKADLIVIRTPKEPPRDLTPVPRYLAKVVVENLEHDLALLEIRYALQLQGVPETPSLEQVVQAIREGRFTQAALEELVLPFLERRLAEEVQPGDLVAVLGWPQSLGGDTLILENGSVSAKRAQDLLVNGFNMGGFDLAGISGGPLILRATEELVGVICGKEVIWLKALRSELAITLLPSPPPPAPVAQPQRPQVSFSLHLTEVEQPLIYVITFDASASTDPDGRIVKYDWDFSDGSFFSSPEPQVKHAYTQFGIYTVTLTVTDDSGLTASMQQNLPLPPLYPCIVIFPREILTEGLFSPGAFTIVNAGGQPLRGELTLDNPDFRVSPASFQLQPGLTQEIRVERADFTRECPEPPSPCALLTIASNDPLQPRLQIAILPLPYPLPGWSQIYLPGRPPIYLAPTACGLNEVTDDFSDPSSGWAIRSDADAETGYVAGEYRILVKEPNRIVWSLAPLSKLGEGAKLFKNSELNVQVRQTSGPIGQYGVLFRFQDGNNFYALSITSAGLYRLDKRVGGEWVSLKPWTPSPAIRTGTGVNQLRIQAVGPQIEIAVNDQPLATVIDKKAALAEAWEIALFAGAFDEPRVEVRFDDFKVAAIE